MRDDLIPNGLVLVNATLLIEVESDNKSRKILYQDFSDKKLGKQSPYQSYGSIKSLANAYDFAVDGIENPSNMSLAAAPTDISLEKKDRHVYFSFKKPVSADGEIPPLKDFPDGSAISVTLAGHSVAIANGYIYALSDNNLIYSMPVSDNMPDGGNMWSIVGGTDNSPFKNAKVASIAVHDNKLYVSAIESFKTKLYVYSLAD